jgi:hypothetical protein
MHPLLPGGQMHPAIVQKCPQLVDKWPTYPQLPAIAQENPQKYRLSCRRIPAIVQKIPSQALDFQGEIQFSTGRNTRARFLTFFFNKRHDATQEGRRRLRLKPGAKRLPTR